MSKSNAREKVVQVVHSPGGSQGSLLALSNYGRLLRLREKSGKLLWEDLRVEIATEIKTEK